MHCALAVGSRGFAMSRTCAKQGGMPVAHVHKDRNVGDVNKEVEVRDAGDCE